MVSGTGSSKFQSLLKGINRLIEEDGLRPGDRLPSERELSERLHAGRSSIREVLRSLELLGLIITKRGEGTFLQPHHSHHLVDLLAGYILRDLKSCQDLLEVRVLLEVGAARLAAKRATEAEIAELETLVTNMKRRVEQGENPVEEIQALHELIIQMANNYLLKRIWYPIVHYGRTVRTVEYFEDLFQLEKAVQIYEQIFHALKNHQENQAAFYMDNLLQHMKLK